MDDRPTAAPELLELIREGRPSGELLSKIPWADSVGSDQAFQYALWCGECDAMLGVLGVFVLRPPNAEHKWPHRSAHCTRCHAHTFFYDKGDRVQVKCEPPKIDHDVCRVCSRPNRPHETRADVLDTSAPETKNGVS